MITVYIYLASRYSLIFRRLIMNQLIIEPDFMIVFMAKYFVFHEFHHRKMRVGQIMGTEDCHDEHFLFKLM